MLRKLINIFPCFFHKKKASSFSDSDAYNNFCLQASSDGKVFDTFRRNSVYNEILEHITEEEGRSYLELAGTDPEIIDRIEEFRGNDRYGSPRTFEYPGVGVFSPTTLRYVKVLTDMKRIFGPLNDLDICEIGVGYGGQCRVINSFYEPKSYCLVDLGPALQLAGRYLGNFPCSSICLFQEMEDIVTRTYDLVVSNYAFTELRRTIQDVYLEKIILQAKRGYITYNDINPPEYRSYKKEELLDMISGARIIDEVPLTHPRNCIIVWG